MHLQDLGGEPSSNPYYDPSAPAYPRPPPNYHLYNRMPVPIPESKQPHHIFFMRDPIREELQYRAEDIWAPTTLPLSAPEEVHVYHTLIPLDAAPERKRYFGSWNSSCYRAMNSTNGNVYALRRVEGESFSIIWLGRVDKTEPDTGFRLPHETALAPIETWSKIIHPNIVHVREAYTTRAFNDNCEPRLLRHFSTRP